MKLFLNILIVSFVSVTANWVYAKSDNNKAEQNLSSSILSSSKVRMMQQLDDQLRTANIELNFAVSNFVSSNNQLNAYKDRKKAFLWSLILPGAGEYYVGKHTFAKAFFSTEITLWLSYFAFRQYGKWVRDDALAFAATHSGAEIHGKPSQFFVDIGNYTDIYEYNESKLRFGEFDKVYSAEDYFWSWDMDGNRQQFENMRIASDRALNRSTFVLGVVFANHLISAIHASWQTHRHNKKLDQMSKSNLHIQLSTNYLKGELSFGIQKEF